MFFSSTNQKTCCALLFSPSSFPCRNECRRLAQTERVPCGCCKEPLQSGPRNGIATAQKSWTTRQLPSMLCGPWYHSKHQLPSRKRHELVDSFRQELLQAKEFENKKKKNILGNIPCTRRGVPLGLARLRFAVSHLTFWSTLQ
jgi:hypothetical protein